jgi:hypothetical protein
MHDMVQPPSEPRLDILRLAHLQTRKMVVFVFRFLFETNFLFCLRLCAGMRVENLACTIPVGSDGHNSGAISNASVRLK